MSVVVGRSRVATKYGIVAASQPLAARAGVQVLERGGNAVDAAIATNAVMGLVEPQSNGIGGDLFAIVYEARTGRLHGLNSHGWAPRGLTSALLKSTGPDRDAVERHSHGDGARRRGRMGRAAHAARHAADGRPPRRGDLLRGRRVSGVGRDRRALGRVDGQARGGARRQDDLPPQRPRAARRRGVQKPRSRRLAAPDRGARAGRLLRRPDRRRDPRDLAREGRHDGRRRSRASSSRSGSIRSPRPIAAGPSTSCRRARRASRR